jgi:hypothetical protein
MEQFKTMLDFYKRRWIEDACVALGDDLCYYITDFVHPTIDNIPAQSSAVAGRFRLVAVVEDLGDCHSLYDSKDQKKRLDLNFRIM